MPSHAPPPPPPLPPLWCPGPVTVPLFPFFLRGRYINEGMVYDVTQFMAEDLHPGEAEAACISLPLPAVPALRCVVPSC